MKYNHRRIETKWQNAWARRRTYEPDLDRQSASRRKPFYNLMMFPYPSAEGLHVGNMYAFTGSDIYGRLKRMQGNDVFEPIGLDGFGIHSENYALKVRKHPAQQAKISEKNFYRQLQSIGNGFAWEERLETYNPDYYRWTQWLFLQLFNNGLAERKKAEVNWCPSCKTVLADEQVLPAGDCERCGTIVIRKELEQWFFKITKYAEKLLKNLKKIDWDERVKVAQKNWIGKSEGAEIDFEVEGGVQKITVFTTRPDTLFGATYLVLSPEHELLRSGVLEIKNRIRVDSYVRKAKEKTSEERLTAKEKTGVELSGVTVINPANKKKISVWVADYVLASYGTGAIMAVPAHDERDFEFAKKFKLPMTIVVCPHYPKKTCLSAGRPCLSAGRPCPVLTEAYAGEGHLVASGKFDGMIPKEAGKKITAFVEGRAKIQYRLRDWLISRQRYWGPPIPLIFCGTCAETVQKKSHTKKYTKGEKENPGWIAAPEKDLPIKLPNIKNVRPTGKGESPLASSPSFYKTVCPKCGGSARRETDVSDTFLDSAWYFYRYLDTTNAKEPFQKSRARKWLPVHMYIGGIEHSVLHLLYSRFIAMALKDLRHIEFEEPFTVFRGHGLITKDGAKMSKSKGNVVVPDEYIKKFGADALRMALMFIGPFQDGGDFRDSGIVGTTRFLERVWRLYHEIDGTSGPVSRVLHKSIKKITEDIEQLRYNTAISELMIMLNQFERRKERVAKKDLRTFLLLLAPFAPHITEELWSRFFADKKSGILDSRRESGRKKATFNSIHTESWPSYDAKSTEDETFSLVIQINGKVRDKVSVNKGIGKEEAIRIALTRERVKKFMGAKKAKKLFFVPDRLISIVL